MKHYSATLKNHFNISKNDVLYNNLHIFELMTILNHYYKLFYIMKKEKKSTIRVI